MDIILYFIQLIQQLYQQNIWLIKFICKYIPLKQWAYYDLSLWVAYYNFLRPHKHSRFRPLVEDDIISKGDNMPAKWQLMIFLGQQTILQMQNNS
ncbi:MAG: hypothetical protein E7279_10300 [Lachnospiraceae bacterium]|nr:hypothetical protein [Lachnospiraceae bacterium]